VLKAVFEAVKRDSKDFLSLATKLGDNWTTEEMHSVDDKRDTTASRELLESSACLLAVDLVIVAVLERRGPGMSYAKWDESHCSVLKLLIGTIERLCRWHLAKSGVQLRVESANDIDYVQARVTIAKGYHGADHDEKHALECFKKVSRTVEFSEGEKKAFLEKFKKSYFNPSQLKGRKDISPLGRALALVAFAAEKLYASLSRSIGNHARSDGGGSGESWQLISSCIGEILTLHLAMADSLWTKSLSVGGGERVPAAFDYLRLVLNEIRVILIDDIRKLVAQPILQAFVSSGGCSHFAAALRPAELVDLFDCHDQTLQQHVEFVEDAMIVFKENLGQSSNALAYIVMNEVKGHLLEELPAATNPRSLLQLLCKASARFLEGPGKSLAHEYNFMPIYCSLRESYQASASRLVPRTLSTETLKSAFSILKVIAECQGLSQVPLSFSKRKDCWKAIDLQRSTHATCLKFLSAILKTNNLVVLQKPVVTSLTETMQVIEESKLAAEKQTPGRIQTAEELTVVDQIISMGFSRNRALLAVRRNRPPQLESAMEWLLLNPEEKEELNDETEGQEGETGEPVVEISSQSCVSQLAASTANEMEGLLLNILHEDQVAAIVSSLENLRIDRPERSDQQATDDLTTKTSVPPTTSGTLKKLLEEHQALILTTLETLLSKSARGSNNLALFCMTGLMSVASSDSRDEESIKRIYSLLVGSFDHASKRFSTQAQPTPPMVPLFTCKVALLLAQHGGQKSRSYLMDSGAVPIGLRSFQEMSALYRSAQLSPPSHVILLERMTVEETTDFFEGTAIELLNVCMLLLDAFIRYRAKDLLTVAGLPPSKEGELKKSSEPMDVSDTLPTVDEQVEHSLAKAVKSFDALLSFEDHQTINAKQSGDLLVACLDLLRDERVEQRGYSFALLQLITALIRDREVAGGFLDAGGMELVLKIPSYESPQLKNLTGLIRTVIRYMIEDEAILLEAMSFELRGVFKSRAVGQPRNMTVRILLGIVSRLASRDTTILFKAISIMCRISPSGGIQLNAEFEEKLYETPDKACGKSAQRVLAAIAKSLEELNANVVGLFESSSEITESLQSALSMLLGILLELTEIASMSPTLNRLVRDVTLGPQMALVEFLLTHVLPLEVKIGNGDFGSKFKKQFHSVMKSLLHALSSANLVPRKEGSLFVTNEAFVTLAHREISRKDLHPEVVGLYAMFIGAHNSPMFLRDLHEAGIDELLIEHLEDQALKSYPDAISAVLGAVDVICAAVTSKEKRA